MHSHLRSILFPLILAHSALWGCDRQQADSTVSEDDGDMEDSSAGDGDSDNAGTSDDDGSSNAEYPLLESLPVDVASINYAVLAQSADLYDGVGFPLSDFGFVIPASSAGPAKANPQPTFWAPLGTAVLAPVDGVVISVETLYSGDFSIMIGKTGQMSSYVWETEHVINVSVAPGDTVTAGQTIATVSDYECSYSRTAFGNATYCGTGIGLVELGLLHGGQVPEHFCPFASNYVDPSAAAAVSAELAAARSTIETAFADPELYEPAGWSTPDCITIDPIEG